MNIFNNLYKIILIIMLILIVFIMIYYLLFKNNKQLNAGWIYMDDIEKYFDNTLQTLYFTDKNNNLKINEVKYEPIHYLLMYNDDYMCIEKLDEVTDDQIDKKISILTQLLSLNLIEDYDKKILNDHLNTLKNIKSPLINSNANSNFNNVRAFVPRSRKRKLDMTKCEIENDLIRLKNYRDNFKFIETKAGIYSTSTNIIKYLKAGGEKNNKIYTNILNAFDEFIQYNDNNSTITISKSLFVNPLQFELLFTDKTIEPSSIFMYHSYLMNDDEIQFVCGINEEGKKNNEKIRKQLIIENLNYSKILASDLHGRFVDLLTLFVRLGILKCINYNFGSDVIFKINKIDSELIYLGDVFNFKFIDGESLEYMTANIYSMCKLFNIVMQKTNIKYILGNHDRRHIYNILNNNIDSFKNWIDDIYKEWNKEENEKIEFDKTHNDFIALFEKVAFNFYSDPNLLTLIPLIRYLSAPQLQSIKRKIYDEYFKKFVVTKCKEKPLNDFWLSITIMYWDNPIVQNFLNINGDIKIGNSNYYNTFGEKLINNNDNPVSILYSHENIVDSLLANLVFISNIGYNISAATKQLSDNIKVDNMFNRLLSASILIFLTSFSDDIIKHFTDTILRIKILPNSTIKNFIKTLGIKMAHHIDKHSSDKIINIYGHVGTLLSRGFNEARIDSYEYLNRYLTKNDMYEDGRIYAETHTSVMNNCKLFKSCAYHNAICKFIKSENNYKYLPLTIDGSYIHDIVTHQTGKDILRMVGNVNYASIQLMDNSIRFIFDCLYRYHIKSQKSKTN